MTLPCIALALIAYVAVAIPVAAVLWASGALAKRTRIDTD